MKRSIVDLHNAREQAVQDRAILFAQILEDCKHPDATSVLLHRFADNSLKYQELTKAISASVDVVDRAPAWVRPFLR